VAILGVFIFHLNHTWLSGGFVGVDIFFVISGYLITSILLRDYEHSDFSLWKFYQRRVARLFPAFLTVALSTLVAAFFIYSPQDLSACGGCLITTLLLLANQKPLWQGGIFSSSYDAQPFLHHWSLSIEEQFYLLFPITLLILYRRANQHMIAILAALGGLSFAACIIVTRINSDWSYYYLSTRVWELLTGSILAIYHSRRTPFPIGASRKLWTWASPIGLALIFLSYVAIIQDAVLLAFPGFIASLPVLGAVCFIGPYRNSDSMAEKLLSWYPLIVIGRMSYSLYLWHWPIFGFIDYKLCWASPLIRAGLKVSLSAVATGSCYFLVEKPCRIFLNRPDKRSLAFGFLSCSLLLLIPLGIAVRQTNYLNATMEDVARGGLVFNPSGKNGSIILMGDSHASMYGKAVKEMARELGFKLDVISVSGKDPLLHSDGRNQALWDASLPIVKREKPDFLVLACYWQVELTSDKDKLQIAIHELKPYVHCLLLVTQPPQLSEIHPRWALRDGVLPPFTEKPEIRTERLKANTWIKSFQGDAVIVLDIDHYFESSNGNIPFFDQNGNQLYRDGNHLSGYGAELVKTDILSAIENWKARKL